MNFAQAVQSTVVPARTENGILAQASTTDPVVDLFYKIGAGRGQNIVPDFERAFQFNFEQAMRVAAWARDVRGGAGEREIFRNILVHLENLHPEVLVTYMARVPEWGRWDDLLVFQTTEFQQRAYGLIGQALSQGNSLCAKWMPRKGTIALQLRTALGMSPKQYRKTLVNLTQVVETQMCAGDWNSINFSHVPSVASARYQRTFNRRASEAYARFKQELDTGEAKINAGAVYPHDVVRTITLGDPVVARAQWEALPNYLGDANILPMVDVSGSMETQVGGSGSLRCIDVSVALGLYCADKNRGPFKDMFLTFSGSTSLQVLRGDILSKHAQLVKSDWGLNTDLHRAFEQVLHVATSKGVSEHDMPRYILILSDMQFDNCSEYDHSAMQMMEHKYAQAGYSMPRIVFWNLADRGTVPVSFNQDGVALVSGFSPAIMSSILAAREFTPRSIMLDTIMVDRYKY